MIRVGAPPAGAMVGAIAAMAVALGLVLLACSDDDSLSATPTVDLPATATATRCEPARPATVGDFAGTVSAGGLERTYLLHVPVNYTGGARIPLVVAFHNSQLDGAFLAAYTLFGTVADEQQFAVVYPDATGEPRQWNADALIDRPDDFSFITALLDKLEGELCLDPERIFVAGYSDGGTMAQRVACEMPERIAALGTVAAPAVNCQAELPWVAFHGMADPRAPFEGGGTSPPVRRAVSEWARGLGCDGLGQISRPQTSVELTTFTRCFRGDGEALLYTIIDGGHTWPGAYALPSDAVGQTSRQIDATRTIWEFFAAHALRE
jgi:polyhydroxybutyrate depolymerase